MCTAFRVRFQALTSYDRNNWLKNMQLRKKENLTNFRSRGYVRHREVDILLVTDSSLVIAFLLYIWLDESSFLLKKSLPIQQCLL